MRELGRAALVGGFVLTLVACGGSNGDDGDGGFDGQVNPSGPDGGGGRGDSGRDAGHTSTCSRDSDCDDGLYCTGVERCMPGASAAGADGCVAGTAPCTSTQTCDEATSNCTDNACADGGDADGDGDPRPECGGHDCNDDDLGFTAPRRKSVIPPASTRTAIRAPSTTTARA